MECFSVQSKDLLDKNKNPNLSLSAEDIANNPNIPKTPISQYDKQANDFLKNNGLKFKATFKGDKCPRWCNGHCAHGDRYWITLSHPARKQRTGFEFWNSVNDMQEGKAPTPYSVLACISGEVHCPDTFEDFCSEFGYDQDSRKANATFNACNKLATKLRAFFTDEEIEQLSEIS